MLKLVIDTNVLIDASEDYYRYANRILDLVLAGSIEAYANQATLRENKLLARRKITDEGYLKKLEYFFDAVKPVSSRSNLDVVADDREDNKILESAVAAHADALITGNTRHYPARYRHGATVLDPAAFLDRWIRQPRR